MKSITEKQIVSCIRSLLMQVNSRLSCDVTTAIDNAIKQETSPVAKNVLKQMQENLDCADQNGIPICQDTGMAVIFAKVGTDVKIESTRSLLDIVNVGVAAAYTDGYLRMSVVADPLADRKNTRNNTPAVLYTELVPGDTITFTVAPKGFGSENMSKIRMFNPTATKEEIIRFVLDVVSDAGSRPCPPIVVGIGIGGTFDYAAYLSKKALTRSLDQRNTDPFYADMEKELLSRINRLNIGPQGFGGRTTALGVAIETYPTHIAGLPVAVNINCHVARHLSATL